MCLSLGQSSLSTSTGLPTVGGTRGVTSQALLPRRPPRGPPHPRRVLPRWPCRAATRSDPTASWSAPPNTQHPPTTKPELPEEAKENAERGAELAAEYLLDTLTYAWNTGDTHPFENMTEPGEKFREGHIKNVNALYANGWMYGNTTTVTNIVSVLPASEKEWGVEPNTIAVVFDGTTNNGIACVGQRIIDKNSDEAVTYAFFMTWKNGGWISTGGSVLNNEQK